MLHSLVSLSFLGQRRRYTHPNPCHRFRRDDLFTSLSGA